MRVRADVHGAVSLVNAISTKKGATLGIDLGVRVEAEALPGSGITIESKNRNVSSRLINRTIEKTVPKRKLKSSRIRISLASEIPAGYGLKSSSAISSAVALACTRLFGPTMRDSRVLLAGVEASIETGVSITGAYDDACACYYGGFIVTDNRRRAIIRRQKARGDLRAVIFTPSSRRRGNPRGLRPMAPVFRDAWEFARDGDYWNAMILNGLAASSVLNSDPGLVASLVEAGALGASVSGNGPAVAAVAEGRSISRIRKVFSKLDGRVTVAGINNKKAEVHEL